MSPLVEEAVDVKLLVEELVRFGWRRGEEYGIKGFRNEYIEWSIFEEKFKEINKNQLGRFEQSKINDILASVKDALKRGSAVEVLNYLKDGIYVRLEKKPYKFDLVDYNNISNNTILVGHEVEFPGSPQNVRPDFVLYINGIPLVVVEVKPFTAMVEDVLSEGLRQLSRYEMDSPELFKFVQLGVVYVGREDSVYRATLPNPSRSERFIPYSRWKPPDSNQYDILDLLRPERLLNLVKWYTFYKGERSDAKVVARYMQYRAAENALRRIKSYLGSNVGKNRGLIWHWQGTGKTYTMFFIAHRFYREYYDRDPLVFFVVDRIELQRQLYEEFIKDIVAPYFSEIIKVIKSIGELRDLLESIKRSEHNRQRIERGIYIVLIQKFRPEDLDIEPIKKREILVLIDEAHRSQYGILGSTLNKILPNAIKIAFTGTPVLNYERNTFRHFSYPDEGELYLDKYFISDSIADGYTVPIVYQVVAEKGGVKLLVDEEEIRKLIDEWIENAKMLGGLVEDVDEEGEEDRASESLFISRQELRRRLNKIKVFLENPERLRALAELIAERVEKDTEWFRYKAMVVAASRLACVRLKKYLDETLSKKYGEDARQWSEVLISYQNNDPEEIREYKTALLERWGKIGVRDVDEVNREIQEVFKERDDPRILIVTDMLITGFDFPRLKVMYLDKPVYGHKLLQTIARVNRPYESGGLKKRFGLVVDSIGLLKHVKESILTYELIGDRVIADDLSKHLVGDVESEFSEFLTKLNELKTKLKSGVQIGRHVVYIDLEEIKTLDREALRKKLEEEVGRQLNVVASGILHASEGFTAAYEVFKLMGDVVHIFDALGNYPKKVDYVGDYRLIRWMYEYVKARIRGRKPPPEFWDYLLNYLYERTYVGEFAKVKEEQVNVNDLVQGIERLSRLEYGSERAYYEIGELIHSLRALLDPANPVHKHLYERVKQLEYEWLTRADFEIQKVLDLAKELLDYSNKIRNLSKAESIREEVKWAVKQRFKVDVELTNFENSLKDVIKNYKGEVYETQLRELKRGLLRDLAKHLKNVDIKEKEKFVEEIIEYIRKIL